MLRINQLRKSYGEKVAVNGIDLHVKPGEIFGFLGPNGARKTTIKMLVGLLKPDAGKIYINSVDNQVEILEAKNQFCYVPDNPDLFEKITGYHYLQFIANIYKIPGSIREERINYLTEKLQLKSDLGSYISSYSHGMRQKVALIGAKNSSLKSI